MNNRARYYTAILEKIATPLMEAVIARGDVAETETTAQAQTMAGLLAASVKASICLLYTSPSPRD